MKNFSTTVFIHFAISLLCVPPNWCSTASCNSMIRWLQDGKNSSITYLCTCNAVQLSKRVCTTVENKLMLVVPTGTKTCVNSRRHSRGKRKEVFAGGGNKQAKHCWIITIYHNCSVCSSVIAQQEHFMQSQTLRYVLDKWPGKKYLGIYRFLPIFFGLGAALEFSMINWKVGSTNFCKMMLN